jgi:hypothetical protein
MPRRLPIASGHELERPQRRRDRPAPEAGTQPPSTRPASALDHLGNRGRLRELGALAAASDAKKSVDAAAPAGPVSLGAGARLPADLRQRMEQGFGRSFGDVRVHVGAAADQAARSVAARAYTVGKDIVFGQGQFDPASPHGRRLIAHELAHVVQQSGHAMGSDSRRDSEADADAAVSRIADGQLAKVAASVPAGTLQCWPLQQVETDYFVGIPHEYAGSTVVDWSITADGFTVAEAYNVSVDTKPNPRAWEDPETRTLYVDPDAASANVTGHGRWDRVLISRGPPTIGPASKPKPPEVPPPKKPVPKHVPKAAPKTPPAKPPDNDFPLPPQVLPETVIGSKDDDAVVPAAVSEDQRPLPERVVDALQADPAQAALLAAGLTNDELAQFTVNDRTQLLTALANNGLFGLDVGTVGKVLDSTPPGQQRGLLAALVADHGKLLVALRRAATGANRQDLEFGLVRLQMGGTILSGGFGTGVDLFDPWGAQGFDKVSGGSGLPDWAKGMQLRTEANGDWTVHVPGQPLLLVPGPYSQALKAHREAERRDSAEALSLSTSGKAQRLLELAEHGWTGNEDEARIINMLRYTPAKDAAGLLEQLKTTKSGGSTLLDKLDQVVDLDNNVELHAELAALRLRARQDDPKLLEDLAKAPTLPWRDTMFHNRAVFTVNKLPDGRIAVTYGVIQSHGLENSEAYAAAMRALPKEMQHGGTLLLQPDDIVMVNDLDGNRQVPLTAADLVAFEHSGTRGMLKHMGNVASLVVPVGLAARGTIGVGQAALEVGGALLAIGSDEYRQEITKWSPGLMTAIDIANAALAIKGGVDMARLGGLGASVVYRRLKSEYTAFKAAAALKMAASGDAAAVAAARLADSEASSLLNALEHPTAPTSGDAASGRVIVDLQSGPMVSSNGRPSFLADSIARERGAQGIGIEPGDYRLGYAGIDPTGAEDLRFSRMLNHNLPKWPATGSDPFTTEWPAWRFDPNAAFPKEGPVVILQGPPLPGQTAVPETFFPPISKSGRVIPKGLEDVAGLQPSTHPALHGKADAIYWRRPFGLGRADASTVKALAAELDRMLKPGGFVEFRVLPSSDAGRALEIAAQMPGTRVEVVSQKAIAAYATSGLRPPNLSDAEWAILEAAGPDIRGDHGALGKGKFNRIIRVYKAP